MTAQDLLTWIDTPECGAVRAQRFYEVLLDIAAGGDLRPPPEADAHCRSGAGAARACTPAATGGPEA